MRVMVLVKATKESETGKAPSKELLAEMGKFNEQLVKAGVMLDGGGLKESAKSARVRFSGAERKVIDGPFAETKELIAGYWLWKSDSLQEAIEWAKKIPNPENLEHEVEIRTVFDGGTCSDVMSQELQEQEARLRAQAAANQK